MKLLKKILSLASSTPNSFLYLELGVLPIEAEIHKRQLMYLHRILQLPNEDPVYQMFQNLKHLSECGEDNWWSQVEPLLQKYGVPENLDTIKVLSKNAFRTIVNKGVYHTSFAALKAECGVMKKTAHLCYNTFGMQEYLKVLFPSQARLILQSRCKTLDIKSHRTYKYSDLLCRGCNSVDETLEHVINCRQDEHVDLEVSAIGELSDIVVVRLSRTANRIQQFYDLCGSDKVDGTGDEAEAE